MIVHRISRPQTLYRRCVLILNIVGMIACFLFVPNLFSIVSLPANIIQLVIIYSLAAESLLRIVTAVMGLQKDEPSEKSAKKRLQNTEKAVQCKYTSNGARRGFLCGRPFDFEVIL